MKPEESLSASLAEWLAYAHPHDNPKGLFYFMVPNERQSGTKQQRAIAAGQLKRMGLRPGTADWVFVWWEDLLGKPRPLMAWEVGKVLRIGFLELKAGSNDQTANQITFQRQAEAFGLRYDVAYTLDECIATLRAWGAIPGERT